MLALGQSTFIFRGYFSEYNAGELTSDRTETRACLAVLEYIIPCPPWARENTEAFFGPVLAIPQRLEFVSPVDGLGLVGRQLSRLMISF